MTNTNMAFRRDLQGLRAVAIVLVILAHARIELFYGGFVGVDVFFVLSGFLISGILFSELAQQNTIGFVRFYSRRLKRLLPALVAMVLLSFGVGIAFLSESEARAQLASAPFAVTWVSNLFFAFGNVGYFDELASKDLFLHTWSLGVEEQFYLIWPLLLFALYRLAAVKKPSGSASPIHIATGLAFAFGVSFVILLYCMENVPTYAFYLMPARIWQFSLGAILWVMLNNCSLQELQWLPVRVRAVLGVTLPSTGVALVFGSAFYLSPSDPYPGLWVLVPSLGAACIILSGDIATTNRRGLLTNPIAVWIGDRAYSLYLWHWPVFTLGFSYGLATELGSVIGMCLVTLILASMSYQWLELPFWKGRLSHAPSKRTLLFSLLVMAVAVLVLFHMWRQLPKPGSELDISNNWRADIPIIYQASCDAWYAHAAVEPCVFGDENFEKTVVLLGDSVGAQWFSVLPEIFTAPLWRTVVLTKSSCAMVDEDYYYDKVGGNYAVCSQWRDAVLDFLDRIKPDVLFMGSAATYSFSDTQWVEGSSRVLERMQNSVGKIFIIPGTPSLTFDGPGCVARALSSDKAPDRGACVAENRVADVEPVTALLAHAADRFDNAKILDLNDLVCPGKDCSAISQDGVVVFRDSQHLTDSFVRSLIPSIRQRLNNLDSDFQSLVPNSLEKEPN